MDVAARRAQLTPCADVDLRNAPRFVAARSGRRQSITELPGDCPEARGICRADGLHAHRVSAADRTPFLWVMGLSDHRLLRANEPSRNAAGADVSYRLSASARHRRHSRLGAVSLPNRRMGARIFRWDAS